MITQPRKIYLGKSFKDCPDCWRNFFHSQFTYPGRYGSASVEQVDEKLEPWNGTIVGYPTGYAIEFNTDEDKLLFLLRWS